MKAIIMAGGEGKRLRPITERMPKPLVPLAKEAIIKRILRHLYKNGIREAAITVGYLSNKIIDSLGEECEGIKLVYFKEEKPLGTAGGVRLAKDFVGDDDFVVVSGDADFDIDIKKAAKRRRELGAEALIILSECENPGEYGVVICNKNGRIKGFSEKPALSCTYSDTVNTGIYLFSNSIFDRIPSGQPYDFGKQLFPDMLNQGIALYGEISDGHWCDIGDPEAYYRANMRISEGHNLINESCHIGDSEINSSVIMDNCYIGDRCKIDSAVICEKTVIENDVIISRGCIIGESSVIEDGAVIYENTRLPAGSIISEGMIVKASVIIGGTVSASALFGENGFVIKKTDFSNDLAIKIGNSLSSVCGCGKIGIMHDGVLSSLSLSAEMVKGIKMSGGDIALLGSGFEAQASYAAIKLNLNLAVFIRSRSDNVEIAFFDSDGLYPKREFERQLISALVGEDLITKDKRSKIVEYNFEEEYYFPFILGDDLDIDKLGINVTRENRASVILDRALHMKGCVSKSNGIRFSVSHDGFSLSAEQNGFFADGYHIKAILIRYVLQREISLPITSPEALSDVCRGKCLFYSHCPSGDTENEAREKSRNNLEIIHACAEAVELCKLISSSGKSLKELIETLPDFYYDTVDITISKKRRLGILTELGIPDGDGVKSEYARGTVRIVPTKDGYRLYAEAAAGEYARELLEFSRIEIERLISESDKEK